MSRIHPVTPLRHASLRWQGIESYRFAAATVLAPLAAAELTSAALALPLAFVRRDGHWTLAAVLGLVPGQNLFVDAAGGWLASYVPATFRGHPFLIGARRDGEPTLCIDEANGLVADGREGEPFFAEDGGLAPGVQRVWSFLAETARSEALVVEACDAAAEAGVIEPWPITVQGEEGPRAIEGLYRVAESRLGALEDGAFLALRRRGVLPVAYAQLLSMGNLARLSRLAQIRAQSEARAAQQTSVIPPLITLPNDSTIDWDWSKIGR